MVFNKEVRKNLKNVFTGKKSVPDESSTTRASLLTVSDQTVHPHMKFISQNAWDCYFNCALTRSSIFSVLSTATTRTQKTARCTARASGSPPCPWTVRSGQLRAAAATWLTRSGTTRSLTAWLLLLHGCTTCVCVCIRACLFLDLFHFLSLVFLGRAFRGFC